MSAIFSTLVKRLRKGGGVISTRAEFSGFATGRNYNTKVSENNETSIKNIGIDRTAAIPCEWVIRSAGQHQWYSRHTFQRQRRSGVKRPERRRLCSYDPKRKDSALRACRLWSEAFVLSAAHAGVSQLRNSPHEWDQGAEGFGRRYGNAYAQRIIGQTIENGLAFGLHEDNRYFRSGKHGIGRLGYAITSTLLTRHDDGSRFISISGIGGPAGSAFISRAWQPRSISSMGSGARSFGIGMGVRASLNIGREFLPSWFGKFLQ